MAKKETQTPTLMHRPDCAAFNTCWPGDCDQGCNTQRASPGNPLHILGCAALNIDDGGDCDKKCNQERAHGVKLDAGRPPVWRGVIDYFPSALLEVAEVSKEGAEAPGHVWGGWTSVVDGYTRYSDAMMRHILEEAQTEHSRGRIKAAATIAWNALARLEHLIADLRE